ncbi:MAG: oligosaccharide flippase family protein [Cetobacterium sp.]|nr:oligosaccharide flippase family protein [Cetobacterium sp.]
MLKIKKLFLNNKIIFENYFFITVLTVLNSLFGLIIYPYLIRVLGAEAYGVGIYVTSIVGIFQMLINLGLAQVASRQVLEKDCIENDVLSTVFSLKLYLNIILLFVFIAVIYLNILDGYLEYYVITYIVLMATEQISFQWYFIAKQKTKIITIISLVFKSLMLPFFFILIKDSRDLFYFIVIPLVSTSLTGIGCFIFLLRVEKISLRLVSFNKVLDFLKISKFYYLSNFIHLIRERSVNIIIANVFGYKDLAYYDLATKIISIFLTLTYGFNTALFPKIMKCFNPNEIRKIIRLEKIIGVLVFIFILIFGEWIIRLLGGSRMLPSYGILVIMSLIVYGNLLAGCYQQLVLIPKNLTKYLFTNQIVGFLTMFLIIGVGLLFTQNILVIVFAYIGYGFSEVIYLNYICSKKYRII